MSDDDSPIIDWDLPPRWSRLDLLRLDDPYTALNEAMTMIDTYREMMTAALDGYSRAMTKLNEALFRLRVEREDNQRLRADIDRLTAAP